MIGKLLVKGVKVVGQIFTSKGELEMSDDGRVTLNGQECRPVSGNSIRTETGAVVQFDNQILVDLNDTIHPAVLYNQLGDGLSFDPAKQEARFVSERSAVSFAQTTGWTTWNHDGSYCSVSQ